MVCGLSLYNISYIIIYKIVFKTIGDLPFGYAGIIGKRLHILSRKRSHSYHTDYQQYQFKHTLALFLKNKITKSDGLILLVIYIFSNFAKSVLDKPNNLIIKEDEKSFNNPIPIPIFLLC